jgi:CubicO group peptidase (beta-lactamase class C family)
MLRLSLIAILALAAAAPRAADARPSRAHLFAERLSAFIDRLDRDPNAPPGGVVVVVQGNRILLARARGVRDAGTGARMTLDTPIYTASTTKSYTGLLAAELDR